MYSSLRLALGLSVIVGAVWASPFEHAVRASNTSSISNSTTATNATLLPSGSSSSNSTKASSTAIPTVDNSSPVRAKPISNAPAGFEAQLAQDAKECHRTDIKGDAHDGNFVFCQPLHLQNVSATETYPFVWDSEAFKSDAENTLHIKYVDDPSDVFLLTITKIPNSKGYALVQMAEEWLKGGKRENLTVYISSSSEPNRIISGPTIVLIPHDDDDDDDSSRSKKKPSKVGIGVGIPFAFGAVAVIAIGAFCIMRKRRRAAKGYLNSKSRSARAGAIQVEEDDFIGGTRGAQRFRDEPSDGGVELQDRRRGRGREEDSLGSLTSTPTEEFGGQGEGRNNNAFRDEISRQRNLRA